MAHVPRCYWPTPLTANLEVTLDGDTAHHLVQVLRCAQGDPITLFSGDGRDFPGTVTSVGKKSLTVRLAEPRLLQTESPLHITLVQSLCRGERMDYAVQKATELGVQVIQPVQTEYSSMRLDIAASEKKQRHWQAIAQSAAEQSYRSLIPSVLPAISLAQWLDTEFDGTRLVLHPEGGKTLPNLPPTVRLALIVGPEGGLSERDLALCQQGKAQPVIIGPRLLRTETAGVATVAALQTLWGDWR